VNDRNRLFDRLADTFVSFCYSVGPDIKQPALLVHSPLAFLWRISATTISWSLEIFLWLLNC